MKTDRFADSIRRKLDSIRPDYSEREWKRLEQRLRQTTPSPVQRPLFRAPAFVLQTARFIALSGAVAAMAVVTNRIVLPHWRTAQTPTAQTQRTAPIKNHLHQYPDSMVQATEPAPLAQADSVQTPTALPYTSGKVVLADTPANPTLSKSASEPSGPIAVSKPQPPETVAFRPSEKPQRALSKTGSPLVERIASTLRKTETPIPKRASETRDVVTKPAEAIVRNTSQEPAAKPESVENPAPTQTPTTTYSSENVILPSLAVIAPKPITQLQTNPALAARIRPTLPTAAAATNPNALAAQAPASQRKTDWHTRIGAVGQVATDAKWAGAYLEELLGKHIRVGAGLAHVGLAGKAFQTETDFDRKNHRDFRKEMNPKPLPPDRTILNIQVETQRWVMPLTVGYSVGLSERWAFVPTVGLHWQLSERQVISFQKFQPLAKPELTTFTLQKTGFSLSGFTIAPAFEWQQQRLGLQVSPALSITKAALTANAWPASVAMQARIFYQF